MSALTAPQEQELIKLSEGYRPNDAVLSHLGDIAVVTVSGPQEIGKTSLIRSLGEPVLSTFTTREQRPDDNGGYYRFRPDTEQEYDAIIDQARAGDLVQFAVGYRRFVYGSTPDDFTAPRTMADISPAGAVELARLPFKSIVHLYLVTQLPVYMRRFNENRGASMSLRDKINSFELSRDGLGQVLEDDRFVMVRNSEGALGATIQVVEDIVSGQAVHDPEVHRTRRIAEVLHSGIIEELLTLHYRAERLAESA